MMTSYRNSDPRPPIMEGTPPPPEWRIPAQDWDRPPWNRWTFQNVRQMVPTAIIGRGSGPSIPIEQGFQDVGGVEFEAVGGKSMTVNEMLEQTYTDGFMIVKGGKTIHESYYNQMTSSTLHLCQSVSKSITSAVAGILIERGLLDPQTQITEYLPELKDTGWNGATLQHLLDMTSGTLYSEDYLDPASDMAKTDVACGWKPIPADADPAIEWPSSMWDQMLTLKEREAEHGSRFCYRSIESDVLGHAMERVTGLRLQQLLTDELWSKIGAEHDACITVDSSGYGLACGGFNATLRDFARFGLLLLNGGVCNGEQIIPSAWIEDIKSGNHGLFDEESREFLPNGCYRNQFWIEDNERETFMCLGVFGQLIYISPEYDLVAVKLSTWPDFENNEYEVNAIRAIHAIAGSMA